MLLNGAMSLVACMSIGVWHCTRSPPCTFSILPFQTIEHVCPVCCKRVLPTVIIQYYPCRCFRQMCPDCDAKLEKSGTDSCDIHFFSSRKTQQQRKRKWPLHTCSCRSSIFTILIACTKLWTWTYGHGTNVLMSLVWCEGVVWLWLSMEQTCANVSMANAHTADTADSSLAS